MISEIDWKNVKFRRYDPILKLMYSPEILALLVYKNDFTQFDLACDFMPWTGMYDKSGKEIYLEDIVVAWSEGVKCTGVVKQRTDGLYIIYPACQNWQFWGLCPGGVSGRKTDVEIIGNSRENKDLYEEIMKKVRYKRRYSCI